MHIESFLIKIGLNFRGQIRVLCVSVFFHVGQVAKMAKRLTTDLTARVE